MVLLVAVVEWREPRRISVVPPRSPPNSGLADAMRASVSPGKLSRAEEFHIPLQI